MALSYKVNIGSRRYVMLTLEMKPRRFIWEEFLVWRKSSACSAMHICMCFLITSDIFIKAELRDFYECTMHFITKVGNYPLRQMFVIVIILTTATYGSLRNCGDAKNVTIKKKRWARLYSITINCLNQKFFSDRITMQMKIFHVCLAITNIHSSITTKISTRRPFCF